MLIYYFLKTLRLRKDFKILWINEFDGKSFWIIFNKSISFFCLFVHFDKGGRSSPFVYEFLLFWLDELFFLLLGFLFKLVLLSSLFWVFSLSSFDFDIFVSLFSFSFSDYFSLSSLFSSFFLFFIFFLLLWQMFSS
jgi:hypothetical protein